MLPFLAWHFIENCQILGTRNVFFCPQSHEVVANTGRIKTDFDTGDTPLPLAERAVLIGSTAHDSTFSEAFLSQS